MPKATFTIFILLCLLLGSIASCTYTNLWDINWDDNALQQKEHFLTKLPNRANKKRPNVILIMADDLGKYEVSSYGAEHISTPNIDAIGANGARFQNAYVTAPICAPSRAAIITGRYQQRYGFETQPMDFYPASKLNYLLAQKAKNRLGDWQIATKPEYPSSKEIEKQGIPLPEINMAELFQASGYKTGLVGKWHLGFGDEQIPNNRGFDYQYGFYGAFSLYSSSRKSEGFVNHIQDDMSSEYQWKMGRKKNAAIKENNITVQENEYLTFAMRDKAKEFVSKNKDANFFLWLSFSAPHVPFQAPQSYYDQFAHIQDKNKRVYLAMIKALDDAIGDFMSHLKKEGLEDNTIVYFISDNGGASYTGATNNGPLKGGKITHFEGGVNVPFMIQWKNKIPDGIVFEQPVSSMDIFTTSLNACGIKLPAEVKIDGEDLLPFLQYDLDGHPHEKLYWRTDHIRAIRYKEWKLLLSTRDDWLHLYNLKSDKSEKIDLKDLNDKEKQLLLQFFDEWNQDLPNEYLWPRIMDRKFIIGNKTYFFPA